MDTRRDQVPIFKEPGEDLRIRWTAAVHEDGGEFVISRQGADGASRIIAHVALRAEGRYEVVEPGRPGSWIYQLRYRSRLGREHVLLTFNLRVEARLRPEPKTTTLLTHASPADTVATPELALRDVARCSLEADAPRLGGPSRWPPTPPP